MNKVLEVIDLITTDLTVKSIINSVNSNQEKSKDQNRNTRRKLTDALRRLVVSPNAVEATLDRTTISQHQRAESQKKLQASAHQRLGDELGAQPGPQASSRSHL